MVTPEASKLWKNKSLVGTQGLTFTEIRAVLDHASELKKLWKSWRGTEFPHRTLKGKSVVNLFIEPSTRTVSSFQLAIERLGGHALNVVAESSSLSKGETLFDTARILEAMDPDLLVLRHASAGAPYRLSKILHIPIINAGDGFHEHPTQALLDALTIEENKGRIEGLRVVIVGDIAHSRVARSNIYLLQTMGAKVTVCGPPSLLPPEMTKFNVTVDHDLKNALKDADVVMMLRVQLERQNKMQFPSLGEYARFWGLNSETISRLKKDAIIMHPGPYNEGVEISQEVVDGSFSVILSQVANGVIVRMALLDLIIGGELR